MEDINILRSKQSSLAGSCYCSSDTFTRVTKQLMDWDHMELKETEKGTETEFFFNQPMNGLLLHSFKRYFGVKGYKTLDHDHTKIFTNKPDAKARSEEHTSELQSRGHLVCRLLLEKKNKTK